MKKFLLSLCVGFLGIISFCGAGSYTYTGLISQIPTTNIVVPQFMYDTNISFSCSFVPLNWDCAGGDGFSLKFYFGGIRTSSYNAIAIQQLTDTLSISCDSPQTLNYSYDFSTFTPPGGMFSQFYGVAFIQFYGLYLADNNYDVLYTCIFTGNHILNNQSAGGGTCDYSGYILESEIDTNYCVGNGLCPNECGSGTDMSGDLQYSNLFINNILHPGKENIFLNIQDNIFWDYSQDDTGYYIDVGSGYDQDYIDGVIDVQSYRPTSEDFTQTFVGGLILFTPYVVILLFVILVWNLIKKIFKTK